MEEFTLAEWLDKWYKLYCIPYLKQSTLISYKGYIKKHIVPYLGTMKLTELNGLILQEFFNEKYQNGKLNKKGGLSNKTVLNIRQMLHAALKVAVNNDLITKNYVEAVRLARVRRNEMRVLTVEEQKHFIAVVNSYHDEYSIGFLLCLSTGIRIGEACALQWNDIDFKKQIIHIRKTLHRLQSLDDRKQKTSIVINAPKSDKSIRDIPFNDFIRDKLFEHRDYIRKTFGKRCSEDNQFVITHSLNKPIEPRTMQDAFKRIINDADIESASIHTLRHTFATRALESGIDFKTLSVILGHADITTTIPVLNSNTKNHSSTYRHL